MLKDILIETYQNKRNIYAQGREEARKNIQTINKKLLKIKELLEEEIYSLDEYKERKAKLESDLVVEKTVASENNIEEMEMETCINYIIQFLKSLASIWINLSTKKKIELNQLLFPKGLIYRNGAYQTAQMHDAVKVFSTSEGGENALMTLPGIEPGLPD